MQEITRVTTHRNMIMGLEIIKLFVNLTVNNKHNYSKRTVPSEREHKLLDNLHLFHIYEML